MELTTRRVEMVRLTPSSGPAREVSPFRMPQSGKQFIAVELRGTPSSVTVEATDGKGRVIDSRTVADLIVS